MTLPGNLTFEGALRKRRGLRDKWVRLSVLRRVFLCTSFSCFGQKEKRCTYGEKIQRRQIEGTLPEGSFDVFAAQSERRGTLFFTSLQKTRDTHKFGGIPVAKITNSQEFLEALKAEYTRRGMPHGIMKVRGKMDPSDTIRYDVVFVPRKPEPHRKHLTPESRSLIQYDNSPTKPQPYQLPLW